jgi:cytochrome c-type biogenesis protein CcmH
LLEGDSNPEVVDFIVDRYGEYVLLQPTFSIGNALIWASGPLLFLLGGWLSWRYVSARSHAAAPAAPAPLSAEEEQRLADLLKG